MVMKSWRLAAVLLGASLAVASSVPALAGSATPAVAAAIAGFRARGSSRAIHSLS